MIDNTYSNTLNLGETQLILNEGLTVSGKPLKNHKAVQIDVIFDIDKPYGEFKVVPNGTYLLLDNLAGGRSSVYHAYSRPFEVLKLIVGLVEYIESCKPHSID